MNEHDLLTLPMTQHFDQPIIETADLENRYELRILFLQLLEKA